MSKIFFLILFPLFSLANEPQSGITIHIQNPALTKKDFSGSGHQIIEYGQEEVQSNIPTRAKRLEAFKAANLLEDVRLMDALDQDMFYMRAEIYSLAKMKSFYPKIEAKKLEKLIRVVSQ